MHYGDNDIRVLKALQRGEAPTVGSDQRLHLEMLGLVVDGAAGLRLTPKGTKTADVMPLRPAPNFDTRDRLDLWDFRRERGHVEQIRDEICSIEAAPPGTGMDPAAVTVSAG